jgi:energy-coupling factor transporter ATP-binding protein EcfA2
MTLATPPPPLLQTRDLWYRYSDQPPALCGINLSIAAGDWLAIIGCNGSGKSTLVKHFNGLLRPWQGQVLLDGQDIAGQSVGQLAHSGIAYLPQNPDRLIFAATVREEIAFGPQQSGLRDAELAERVDESLALLDLTAYVNYPPAVLGYGLRRKVALAAILALRPRLLVLDEPTNGLDAGSTRAFMDVVANRHRRGVSVVMITHDLELVAQFATAVALLREGQLVTVGPTRRILSDISLLTAAGLEPLPITRLAALCASAVPSDLLTPAEFADAYCAWRLRGYVAEGRL